MSIAATKMLQNSERFMLVRFTPARCIDAALASVGGGVYQMTWTQPVAQITVNGSPLTLVTTLTGNNQYTFNEATNVLQVQLASAPNDTSNVVILFYYLFFTSGMAIMANQDPLDSSTPLRQWAPRIVQTPELRQSMRNIIAGVFTLDTSSVQLANTDGFFNQWFSPDDSFKFKDIDVWQGMRAFAGNAPDFQRVYKGKLNSPTLTDQVATFSIYDAFSGLQQPALMGDDPLKVYVSLGSGSYPSADPSFVGSIVPYHVGRFSYFKTKYVNVPTIPKPRGDLDPDNLPQAFCSNYDVTNILTSTNRQWTLGRCSPDGSMRSFALPLPSSNARRHSGSGTGYETWEYLPSEFAALDVAVGDCFLMNDSGVNFYAWIDSIYGPIAALFGDYFLDIALMTAGTPAGGTTIVTTYPDPAIVIVDENGLEYHPAPGRDFTTSETTLSSGNVLVQINFATNFEANLTTTNFYPANFPSPLNPQKHKVYYRLRPNVTNYTKHGDALKRIMSIAGLTPNAATFAAANTALPLNLAVSIPNVGETSLRNYIDYAEDILASTLGIVSLDSSAQVQYALLSAPSSTNQVDDTNIQTGSYSIAVTYDDVVTQLVAENPHNANSFIVTYSPSPYEVRTNYKALYLHGVSNSVVFTHCLETITSRIDEIMAAKSNRLATYQFDVSTLLVDAKLGDDVLISNKFLLGSDTTRAVRLILLDRTDDKSRCAGVDLQGVT